MKIMTRRNAVVGYLALRALRRARRNAALGYVAAQGLEHTRAHRRSRRAAKISLYVALGIVSAGVLAAIAAYATKRKSSPGAAPEAEEALDSVDEASDAVAEEAAEVAAAAAEPLPAT